MAFKSKAKKSREAALSEKVKELGQEVQRLQLKVHALTGNGSMHATCRDRYNALQRSSAEAYRQMMDERDHYREKVRQLLGVMEDARELAVSGDR